VEKTNSFLLVNFEIKNINFAHVTFNYLDQIYYFIHTKFLNILFLLQISVATAEKKFFFFKVA
jgi:hypothetical protein